MFYVHVIGNRVTFDKKKKCLPTSNLMTCGKIHAFYQSTDYNLDFFNLVVLGICYGYFCGV